MVKLPSGLIPSRSVLDGNVVTLEPIDPGRHGSQLYAAGHGSPEQDAIWDYMAYGPWTDEADMTSWLRGCAASHDPMFFAIRPKDGGKAVGMCSYLNIVPGNGSIEIGHIWFGPELQRTRAATEALFLLLDYAMTDLNYRRMEWKCNALNQRSRKAAHRLGFRFEGVFYNHLIFKGQNRDTAWFSILDDEWPEVRAHLQAWLSDGNFDDDGKPKTSLAEAMQDRTSSKRG
ncbi:MAG: GNAT family N-acetyltransferase [Rhizobiales bacterium]|nr:GNAT family N-acetyltransferase [Hyphomicrobiales bacterium]